MSKLKYEDVPATKMVTALENLLAEVLDVGRRIEALEAELELVKVDVGNLEHPFS